MEDIYAPIGKLLYTLEKTGKHYDLDKIKKAYLYAAELHDGQFRISGEPYISHPIAVAEIVSTLELDTDSICAALLHDTVEDCGPNVDLERIKKMFGEDVASLVDGVTKLITISFDDKEEEQIENLRKMFLAMSHDIRVIFIKLCDRLHNMRTLGAKRPEKQRTTALETMHVYAPLAHRLGMQRIKQELENLSLQFLDPVGYGEIKKNIEDKYGNSRDFVESARAAISEKLDANNIKYSLEGRVKTVYSLYKKMFEQGKSFEEIFDFYALRIIVDTELECYTVLGIIHDMFKSVPGRFKDYISTPKPNMYRSLHTTVIGKDGVPFEVQIRTWQMHRIAEYGLAAHWKYKSGAESKNEIDEKLQWVAKLIDAQDDTKDPEEFFQALKIDIFHDETFVFTPRGDVINLPYGSTVIDFAYAIHSEVGNKMVGAKINGMIVPIDRMPQNGEIVEIITSNSSKGPTRDWLKIVRTGEARTKIRQWFKKEKQAENIQVGMSEIDSEFKKFGYRCTEEQKEEILSAVAARIGIQSVESLFNTIGYGGLSIGKISLKIKDEYQRVVKPAPEEAVINVDDVAKKLGTDKNRRKSDGVIIDGVEGCSVKFAKCCNPLPGDEIIGFITKGYGVSVHKKDCPNVAVNMNNPEYDGRWVPASFESDTTAVGSSHMFEAVLKIVALSSISILAEITTILADMRVSLVSINTQSIPPEEILINLTVTAKNLEHVNSIIQRLRTIKNVVKVTRGYGQ